MWPHPPSPAGGALNISPGLSQSYEEVARANNSMHEAKVRFVVFRNFIKVDLQLQLLSSSLSLMAP